MVLKTINEIKPESLRQSNQSTYEQARDKILITGANGYIGSNLHAFLKGTGHDVFGVSSKEVQGKNIYQLNLADPEKILSILVSTKPTVIVHTAALSSLEQCEKNPELANRVNVVTTRNLVQAILKANKNIKFVFISSDYVFDGKRGNYREEEELNPQTVYGKTKASSEATIKECLENYAICRTANVYGNGGNFFNFVLSALNQNKPVEVFNDAFYTPTYLHYLLDSLKMLIELNFKGVIHVAGPERLSRYDFALKMAETLGKEKSLVQPVKACDKLLAKDSSLNCEYSCKVLGNFWPGVVESLHYCFGNLVQPYFYHVDQRGMIVGVFRGLKWEEINYIESIKGSVRGNHYHKETTEGIFVIDGKIKVTLVDLAKRSQRTFTAEKGATLIIHPNILHTFEMLNDSKWINMLSISLKDNAKDIHQRASALS